MCCVDVSNHYKLLLTQETGGEGGGKKIGHKLKYYDAMLYKHHNKMFLHT